MNRSNKFVENLHSADSSLFLDGVNPKNLHDASFNERLKDDDQLQFNQQDLHGQSINELLRKRHNTTERTTMKQQRPRSSKGYRGYSTQSNSTSQIPKISSKSEERNLKS